MKVLKNVNIFSKLFDLFKLKLIVNLLYSNNIIHKTLFLFAFLPTILRSKLPLDLILSIIFHTSNHSPLHHSVFIPLSIASNYLFFDLYPPLFPSTFIFIFILVAYDFFFLITCSNDFNLISFFLFTIDIVPCFHT